MSDSPATKSDSVPLYHVRITRDIYRSGYALMAGQFLHLLAADALALKGSADVLDHKTGDYVPIGDALPSLPWV